MSGESLETKYLRTYGGLLNAAQTAKILGYKSTGALARARSRGTLPFKMFLLPKRRGWFADTTDVAAFVSSIKSSIET